MKRNIISIGMFGLLGGLISFFLWPHTDSTLPVEASTNETTPTPESSLTPQMDPTPTPLPVLKANPSRVPASEAQQKAWERFAKQFGSHLRPEFSEDGFLSKILSMQNGTPPGIKNDEPVGSENFDPKNSIQGLKRAKEILEAAQELLQIQSDWPLENATIQNGPLSCQVYWTQTHQGFPVLPGGAVKIDLGSKGELLELQSTYLHSIQIVNQVHLTQDEAESRIPGSGPIYGGNLIIWNTGNNQGHMAYQMSRNGRQIILDADTGRILMNRDRRQF